jgi:hypothetical protein
LNQQKISFFKNFVKRHSASDVDLSENNVNDNNKNNNNIFKEFIKQKSNENANRNLDIKLKKVVIIPTEKRDSIKSYRNLLKRKDTNKFIKDAKIIDKE